jgi:spermidine/putrescine transport system substrate-binding protein
MVAVTILKGIKPMTQSGRWRGWLLLLLLGASRTVLGAPRELTILNWPDYMDRAVIADFERAFNVKVREVYFEAIDKCTEMLLDNDGKGYDLVMVSHFNLEPYRQQGWLGPLDTTRIPNLRHIGPRWMRVYPGGVIYSVPYFWGTVGIAYREDLVATAITTWKQLFLPDPSQQGKIMMIDSVRDSIGFALKALGYSFNSTNPAELAEAEKLLKAQRPSVKAYGYIKLKEDSEMLTGSISMALLYNGDALMLSGREPRIRFVIPQEGSSIWVDHLALMSKAREKELAHAFLNFINEPIQAARLAKFVHYATPNQTAEALMPESYRKDPIIYPPPQVLERCEDYQELPPQTMKLWNQIYARVLASAAN